MAATARTTASPGSTDDRDSGSARPVGAGTRRTRPSTLLRLRVAILTRSEDRVQLRLGPAKVHEVVVAILTRSEDRVQQRVVHSRPNVDRVAILTRSEDRVQLLLVDQVDVDGPLVAILTRSEDRVQPRDRR